MPAYATGSEPAEGTSVKGDREYEELFGVWDERLPDGYSEFFAAVVELTMEEKLQLNALCVAASLNAVSSRQDFHRKKAWAQLGLIAGRAGVVMAEAWTPDGEFLKGAKKASLVKAIRDMDGDVDAHAKDKVGVLVEVVGRMAARNRWVPELLANLTAQGQDDEARGSRAALAAAMGAGGDASNTDEGSEG
jgi:ParB family chromosome partitioning protein